MFEYKVKETDIRGVFGTNKTVMPGQLRERYAEYTYATVGILFLNKNKEFSRQQVLGNLDYYHLRSACYLDFYLPGFDLRNGGHKFDMEEFVEFIEYFEASSKWRYGGETELLLLQFNKETGFDFSKCISIWVDKAVADGYIYSFSVLFEQLIQTARKTMEVSVFSKGLMLEGLPGLIFENILAYLKNDVAKTLCREEIYRLRDFEP